MSKNEDIQSSSLRVYALRLPGAVRSIDSRAATAGNGGVMLFRNERGRIAWRLSIKSTVHLVVWRRWRRLIKWVSPSIYDHWWPSPTVKYDRLLLAKGIRRGPYGETLD